MKAPSLLTQCIGAEGVTALVSKFAGQRIYVPWRDRKAMAAFVDNFGPLIGRENAQRLIDDLGGQRFAVPTRTRPKRRKGFVPVDFNRVAILTARDKLTAAQIAGLLKCDPRSVHKARTKARSLGLLPSAKRKVRK